VHNIATYEARHFVVIFGGPFWTQDLPKLLPGAHIAVISHEADVDGIEGRKAGYELRDTLLVLGPGVEPDRPFASYVLLFRKSLSESTVAEQILSTGTGALNIDACRVASDLSEFYSKSTGKVRSSAGHAKLYGMKGVFGGDAANPPHEAGRWPPNMLIVHSEGCKLVGTRKKDPTWKCVPNCAAPYLDALSGISTSRVGQPRSSSVPGRGWGMTKTGAEYSDTGGASRYFPQFKCSEEMIDWLSTLLDSHPVYTK
jgi:hypothetical protein